MRKVRGKIIKGAGPGGYVVGRSRCEEKMSQGTAVYEFDQEIGRITSRQEWLVNLRIMRGSAGRALKCNESGDRWHFVESDPVPDDN